MTDPTMPPPPPPAYGGPGPAAAGNDRSQLLGIIGIIVGLICCWPAGVILGVISLVQANKFGSTKLWGILALVASVINIIGGSIYYLASR